MGMGSGQTWAPQGFGKRAEMGGAMYGQQPPWRQYAKTGGLDTGAMPATPSATTPATTSPVTGGAEPAADAWGGKLTTPMAVTTSPVGAPGNDAAQNFAPQMNGAQAAQQQAADRAQYRPFAATGGIDPAAVSAADAVGFNPNAQAKMPQPMMGGAVPPMDAATQGDQARGLFGGNQGMPAWADPRLMAKRRMMTTQPVSNTDQVM